MDLDLTISRKEFLRECKKQHVIESYQNLIDRMISILQHYKITVDKIVPLGEIVNLDEIRLYLSKAITKYAGDKRLASPANTPEAIARGTVRLMELVRSQQAAIDPAFLNVLFFPDASLQEANKIAWEKQGTLKISHTKSELVMEVPAIDQARWETLKTELAGFVAQQTTEESYRVSLITERAKLMEDYQRVMKNKEKVDLAVEKALEEATRAVEEEEEEMERKRKEEEEMERKRKEEEEMERKRKEEEEMEKKEGEEEGEEKKKEGEEEGEKKKEEEGEEKKKEEEEGEKKKESEEEKPAEPTEPVISQAKLAKEAREREMEMLKEMNVEIADILKSIQNDAYMRASTENHTALMNRMMECDQKMLTIATQFPDVALEIKHVEPGKLCTSLVTPRSG